MYEIYQAAGWHGYPEDPLICTTEDRREAALMAGCRVDMGMPGQASPYSCYALDEDGNEVARIDAYCCDRCDGLFEWGDGPIATREGRILECPESVPNYLITWLCGSCADALGD